MKPADAQLEPNGAFSPENTPKVVVRAGKHFVCSSCGTQVEIPDEIVGQLVLVPEDASQKQASEELTSQRTPVQTRSPQKHRPPCDSRRSACPPQPKCRRRSTPRHFAGRLIEGLLVPSGKQLDRAISWVSFHLKVLDRQGSEIQRLRKLLHQPTVPGAPPRPHANDVAAQQPQKPSDPKVLEDASIAPIARNASQGNTPERGPP